ncbi:hypothetical protein ACA910_021046 [Epithemia clementina (nom. ined.)]
MLRRNHQYTRYALSVQYHGPSFLGFSHQPAIENELLPNGSDFRGWYSVEGRLLQALSSLLQRRAGDNNDYKNHHHDLGTIEEEEQPIQFPAFENFQVSSRTDRGVHALHNTLHVDISPQTKSRLRRHQTASKLDSLLGGINYYLQKQSMELVGRSGKESVGNHLRVLNVRLAPDVMNNRFFDEGDPLSMPTVDWNARHSATERIYLYRIMTGIKDENNNDTSNNSPLAGQWAVPFEHNLSWHVPGTLDVRQMCLAASCLRGTHDFSTFRNAGCQRKSPVVTLFDIEISSQPWSLIVPSAFQSLQGEQQRDCASNIGYSNGSFITGREQIVTILVRGNAFLYKQVRNLVACLVAVGQGRLSVQNVRDLLEARQRSQLECDVAPAHGLFLAKVRHGDFII